MKHGGWVEREKHKQIWKEEKRALWGLKNRERKPKPGIGWLAGSRSHSY